MAYFEQVLNKLGWNDGFQIPVANDENKALEAELARLSLHKIKAKNVLENLNSKVENLKRHNNHVSHESEQIQKLLMAYKQRLDAEKNNFHVMKAEKSKSESDINQTLKKIKQLEDTREAQKNELQKALIKVDKMKSETGWDLEALKAWEESLKKRDEDNELIKKFSREDERKFNELEARRQNLQTEYDAKNAAVQNLVGELHSCEMIVERTGKAIKQQFAERECLIRQWKDAIKMLHQRDADISAEQQHVTNSQEQLEKLQERLGEENEFLQNEQKHNRDIQLEIQKLNSQYSRAKLQLDDLIQKIYLIVNETHGLRRAVTGAARHLEQTRLTGKMLSEQIDQKERLRIKTQEELTNLEQKLQEMKGTNVTSAERITKIQNLIDGQENSCKIFISDTERINNNLYRMTQVLTEQKDAGKILETNLNNVYCMCAKLKKHISDEKKSLEKIKEVVYNMDYRIDEFEQKLCKVEGSDREEQADERLNKIKDLETVLSEHAEVQHTLQNQVDRLREEMRRLWNFLTSDKKQLEELENKVENYLLAYDVGRKQIDAAKRSIQEKQVEESMMRLRINHIEDEMEKEDCKIFNLQKLRVDLDLVMKERQIEIDTRKAVILAKKRNLEDEVGKLKTEIGLRKIKLDQLQKKYHMELMSLGKDQEGQNLSITHYKIKHAQEKFFLQQEGDELDTKIKKAEQEIIAMENTLKIVNLTNVKFKSNLIQVKENDLQLEDMKSLGCQLNDVMIRLKYAKEGLEAKRCEVNEIKEKLEEMRGMKLSKLDEQSRLEEENILVEKQERSKEEKLARAELQLKKVTKKIGNRDTSLYDQDLEIRHLKEANKTVQKQLMDMATSHPEMGPLINKYADEQDVDLYPSPCSSSLYTSVTSSSSSSCSGVQMESVTIKKVNISWK
ncbi:coiled-coil domain-containing protein 39 [Cylas formicarius]|uniref:coiled-coil domain-containing protein 39 n=1 Tax=Cylas formicarius TaxID=197179 RepID=UPI002958DBCB|nr:coiled-coil domain-containing protein 39 [Cylas formicarius]